MTLILDRCTPNFIKIGTTVAHGHTRKDGPIFSLENVCPAVSHSLCVFISMCVYFAEEKRSI